MWKNGIMGDLDRVLKNYLFDDQIIIANIRRLLQVDIESKEAQNPHKIHLKKTGACLAIACIKVIPLISSSPHRSPGNNKIAIHSQEENTRKSQNLYSKCIFPSTQKREYMLQLDRYMKEIDEIHE